ncbi:MAG: hypothetical protein U5K69_08865 [Balneolaceae bacterium]|nr:hypothetical protein [Balneolaceae bacterium]
MGLGNIIDLTSVPKNEEPLAAYGKMREISPGKDSTTGHWELAGIQLDTPFPTYPGGFPKEIISAFCKGIGVDEVLCNKPISGTAAIAEHGEEHLQTGRPIFIPRLTAYFRLPRTSTKCRSKDYINGVALRARKY